MEISVKIEKVDIHIHGMSAKPETTIGEFEQSLRKVLMGIINEEHEREEKAKKVRNDEFIESLDDVIVPTALVENRIIKNEISEIQKGAKSLSDSAEIPVKPNVPDAFDEQPKYNVEASVKAGKLVETKGRQKKQPEIDVCEVCNVEFEKKSKDQRMCGRACASKYARILAAQGIIKLGHKAKVPEEVSKNGIDEFDGVKKKTGNLSKKP